MSQDHYVNVLRDLAGASIIGPTLAAPFDIDIALTGQHRWGLEFGVTSGTATIVVNDLFSNPLDLDGVLIKAATVHPEDVNSEVPITYPDLATGDFLKIWDRLVGSHVGANARGIRFTITPTALVLSRCFAHHIGYNG